MINLYNNVKDYYVRAKMTVPSLLEEIKEPKTSKIKLIETLRGFEKGSKEYNDIKNSLPVVRWNFDFRENVKSDNDSVKESTGVIYIDYDTDTDDVVSIDLTNELIYSSWISVGGKGRGILVKVKGIDINNFGEAYIAISKELGIKSDAGAKKPIQCNVLSYDEHIYINNKSRVFDYEEYIKYNNTITNNNLNIEYNKKGDIWLYKEKREGLIQSDVTTADEGDNTVKNKIRHNSFHTFFNGTEDSKYIVFEEKQKTVIPFIPKRIQVGSRNTTFLSVLTNYIVLNPTISFNYLMSLGRTINSRCVQPYSEDKIKGIINALIKKRDEGDLVGYANAERRIVFNPDATFDKKEKQKISGMVTSKLRADKTLSEIYETMEGWDFETNGKLTIDKLSEVIGKSSRTVKRHMKNNPELKDYMKDLNSDHKGTPKPTKIAVDNTNVAVDNTNVAVEDKVSENEENDAKEGCEPTSLKLTIQLSKHTQEQLIGMIKNINNYLDDWTEVQPILDYHNLTKKQIIVASINGDSEILEILKLYV